MNPETLERFVESWGSMGALWGINRSMARIHALLMASGEPVSQERIAETLAISRGNASMSLKELRSWGVIRRVNVAGDRRDFYETEPDVWSMFFRIARERKRREFDPILGTVRGLLKELPEGSQGAVRERFEQMAELLETGDRIMRRFLADEKASRGMMAFLSQLGGAP